MDEAQKMLHCSLKHCETANAFADEYCTRCKTPLIKRFLWVMGTSLRAEEVGTLMANRYWVVSENLVLETKPSIPPHLPERIPPKLKPYLKLSAYRLHIPKLYGTIPTEESEIWLLEYENFSSVVQHKFTRGEFLPPLAEVWKGATGTRQLNWLLQMSQLWQPLQAQKVVSTLMTPELLRVNGSVVQLQELRQDEQPVTLKDLGKLWSAWNQDSEPEIQGFVQEVCDSLTSGELTDSEGLVRFLEEGLSEIARSQFRSYQISTLSDAGPTRSHNEDAYFQDTTEQSGDLNHPSQQKALAIVCDGVGGHQGGEVASHLAIEHLREEMQRIQKAFPNSRIIAEKIGQAVAMVNDLICDRNDLENRQAQQRMGTTLVMTLAHDHEMYVTHVGDSRVYWITHHGCYQLTLDDDLASRQTRLGHLLYREALQQPAAGALVQALGMSSSNLLHPTTQRLIMDEDCVFLLCSDGLSDNGLVEQYWEQEILPILTEEKDVGAVTRQLIHLANSLNGHDNVTVSLVKCSVSMAEEETTLNITFQEQTDIQGERETMFIPQKNTVGKQVSLGWTLVIVALLVSGMGVAYSFLPEVRHSLDQFYESLKGPPMRDPSDLPAPDNLK